MCGHTVGKLSPRERNDSKSRLAIPNFFYQISQDVSHFLIFFRRRRLKGRSEKTEIGRLKRNLLDILLKIH